MSDVATRPNTDIDTKSAANNALYAAAQALNKAGIAAGFATGSPDRAKWHNFEGFIATPEGAALNKTYTDAKNSVVGTQTPTTTTTTTTIPFNPSPVPAAVGNPTTSSTPENVPTNVNPITTVPASQQWVNPDEKNPNWAYMTPNAPKTEQRINMGPTGSRGAYNAKTATPAESYNQSISDYQSTQKQYEDMLVSRGYAERDQFGQVNWKLGGQAAAVRDEQVKQTHSALVEQHNGLKQQKEVSDKWVGDMKRMDTYIDKQRADLDKQFADLDKQMKANQKERDALIKKRSLMKPGTAEAPSPEYDALTAEADRLTAEADRLDAVSANLKHSYNSFNDMTYEEFQAVEQRQADEKRMRGNPLENVGDMMKTGLDKVGQWAKDNDVGGKLKQAGKDVLSEVIGGLAAPNQAPGVAEAHEMAMEGEARASKMDEAAAAQQGIADRNVMAQAGEWTESAAKNAADIAAQAQGGDTGAGAAIARQQAAQQARSEAQTQNQQRAQARSDTARDRAVSLRDTAGTYRQGAMEQRQGASREQNEYNQFKKRQGDEDELHEAGLNNIGAGPSDRRRRGYASNDGDYRRQVGWNPWEV